jgi:hypothetical protein
MRPVPSGAVLSSEITDDLGWDWEDYDVMFASATDWGQWEAATGDGGDGGGGGDGVTVASGDDDDGGMGTGFLLPALVVIALGVPAALAIWKGSRSGRKD